MIIAYCVINLTMQTFIQPKFVSDAVRLSLTLTFFSVVFWAIVLGPIGAVLAIPATLLVRALLLDTDPDAFWARSLTGDSADPPTAADEPERRQHEEPGPSPSLGVDQTR